MDCGSFSSNVVIVKPAGVDLIFTPTVEKDFHPLF